MCVGARELPRQLVGQTHQQCSRGRKLATDVDLGVHIEQVGLATWSLLAQVVVPGVHPPEKLRLDVPVHSGQRLLNKYLLPS